MKKNILFALFSAFLLGACSNNSEKEPIIPELTDEVLVYEPEKISDNLVLVNDA